MHYLVRQKIDNQLKKTITRFKKILKKSLLLSLNSRMKKLIFRGKSIWWTIHYQLPISIENLVKKPYKFYKNLLILKIYRCFSKKFLNHIANTSVWNIFEKRPRNLGWNRKRCETYPYRHEIFLNVRRPYKELNLRWLKVHEKHADTKKADIKA